MNKKFVFKGQDGSAGYRTGKTYDLRFHKSENAVFITQEDGKTGPVGYSSMASFMENWELASKEEKCETEMIMEAARFPVALSRANGDVFKNDLIGIRTFEELEKVEAFLVVSAVITQLNKKFIKDFGEPSKRWTIGMNDATGMNVDSVFVAKELKKDAPKMSILPECVSVLVITKAITHCHKELEILFDLKKK